MKYKRITLSVFLCLTLVLIFTGTRLFAQGTEIDLRKSPGFYMGFNINPSQTYINNTGTKSIKDLISTKNYSVSGSLETGFFFNQYFGLSVGLGFNSYSSELSLETYSDSLTMKDTEQENYRRIISGIGISETQKIGLLTIPLLVDVNIPVNDNFGFYLQTGINLSLPVTKKYTSIGTMTYKGYYQAYNVYIYGVDHEDFASNVRSEDEGELIINSFDPELVVSGGFQFFVQNRIQVVTGLFFNKLLTNISGYPDADSYYLSMKKNEMKSLMEGSSEARAQAIGLRVGFRYFIK